MKETFLFYLDNWEATVAANSDVPGEVKHKMLLSSETMEGLRITGLFCVNISSTYSQFVHLLVNSFIEMSQFLLSKSEGLFLLSERVSQDSLENYFGKQRARGGRNENPNLQQCLTNAAALRLQGSISLDPVRGNCRGKRYLDTDEPAAIDSTPLPRRKRRKLKL